MNTELKLIETTQEDNAVIKLYESEVYQVEIITTPKRQTLYTQAKIDRLPEIVSSYDDELDKKVLKIQTVSIGSLTLESFEQHIERQAVALETAKQLETILGY